MHGKNTPNQAVDIQLQPSTPRMTFEHGLHAVRKGIESIASEDEKRGERNFGDGPACQSRQSAPTLSLMSHAIATHYYLLHFLGIMLVFSAYGALIARGMLGSESPALRKFGLMATGIGLTLMLVSGFGIIAKRPDFDYVAPWVIIKMVLFLALAGMQTLITRKPGMSQLWFWITIVIGAAAALVALYKPGGV